MYHFDLGRQYASDYVMGFCVGALAAVHCHHLLMCRHLPTAENDAHHFTWENNHVVEKVDLADVSAL